MPAQFLPRLSGWWDFAARLVGTTGLTLGNCGPVSVRGSGQADLDQVLAIRIRPRTLRRARSEALGKIAKASQRIARIIVRFSLDRKNRIEPSMSELRKF